MSIFLYLCGLVVTYNATEEVKPLFKDPMVIPIAIVLWPLIAAGMLSLYITDYMVKK